MEKENSISLEKILHVSLEKVWSAWTDPAHVTKWFGSDPNGKVLQAKLDVRPGGRFEITFEDPDRTEHTCSGVYDVVEKFKKLTFSWMWRSEPGVESFVTIELTSDSGNTRMQFEHANLGLASKHNYIKGWESTFMKLEKVLDQ